MTYIVNALAQYEVHVARYYFQRGAYVAAIGRAQQNHEYTPGRDPATEALYILIRSYDALGMTQLRDDARRVYGCPPPRHLSLRMVSKTSKSRGGSMVRQGMSKAFRLTASTGIHKGDRDYQQDQRALLAHQRYNGCVLGVRPMAWVGERWPQSLRPGDIRDGSSSSATPPTTTTQPLFSRTWCKKHTS